MFFLFHVCKNYNENSICICYINLRQCWKWCSMVTSTWKQTHVTELHWCTLLSLVTQEIIKHELSHLSKGRGSLLYMKYIRLIHNPHFLLKLLLTKGLFRFRQALHQFGNRSFFPYFVVMAVAQLVLAEGKVESTPLQTKVFKTGSDCHGYSEVTII